MIGQALLEMIEVLKDKFTIKYLCSYLGIPRSTYYRWKKMKPRESHIEDKVIEVEKLCKANKFRYGYRKITALLKRKFLINHKTVQKIMQKNHWQCKVRVKKRKRTGQPFKVVENLINRDFKADKPLEKLVTDITYLPFGGKYLYLSSILDVFNGEIVAYTIRDTQDTSLVLDTLAQLKTVPEGCVLHSDQGSVYTSQMYQQAIKEKGITMSMSRKGTPADNAPIESFHSTLKSETFYMDGLLKTTTGIVEETVHQYINYYNNIRIQTKLNNQSPITYRKLVI